MSELLPASMVETTLVANRVLHISFEYEVPLSPPRLQAMLFELQLLHLRETGQFLIGERVSAHDHGPRFSSLEHQFAKYTTPAAPIRTYAKDARSRSYMSGDMSVAGRAHLVLGRFGNTPTLTMVDRQRDLNTPWRAAFNRSERFIDQDKMLAYAQQEYRL